MHTRIKAEITALAQASPSEEICGFIFVDRRYQPKVFPCKNVAHDPSDEFEIDVRDHIQAMKMGTLLGVYHSHPGEPKAFSGGSPDNPNVVGDIEFANHIALPSYLVNAQDASWYSYIPSTYRPPLEGRAFCIGFSDCYETPRLFHRLKNGIYMNDYDRDESFKHEDDGTILANYEKEGFVRLEKSDKLKIGDVLLFRTDRDMPQHFAVFVGNGYMLHHRLGRLSEKALITDAYWDSLFGICRHKTFI